MDRHNQLDLSQLELIPGVQSVQHDNGSRTFTLLPVGGAYGAVSPPIADWWPGRSLPVVLRVDIEAEVDAVGVALFSPDLSSLQSGEKRVLVSDGRTTVSFYVDEEASAGRLMIRNYGATDQEPRIRLHGVRVESVADLPPVEVKRIRASEFTFWYYSMDLGDGVITQAGFPDAPIDMRGHYMGRRIMQWLLDRHFAGVKGKTVIEAGCSGGFHTFETARAGAKVTAFDVDDMGLRQAKLAAEFLSQELPVQPKFVNASIYDFRADPPADIYYCSGVLYHLHDIAGAARMIAENCTQGAVIQSSISTLPGDLLEFAGTARYGFAVPRGEFAFIPTRSILPHIFAWAGFREQHWYDLSEFHSDWDDEVVNYRPGVLENSSGPVYAALLK